MNQIHHSSVELDLNLLKVFEAVYREQHLSRASQSLFLTPSAVSHALRRMREYLDDPLFERDGRSMRPTPLCRRLAPDLLDALATLRRVLHRAKSFDPASSRQAFQIGIPETMEPVVLPPLIKDLRALAPHVGISAVRVERRELERELGSGRLELAIDVAQSAPEPVRHRPLARQDFCVLMREDHPFAKRLTLKRYLAAQHLVVSTRRSGPSLGDLELRRLGHQRDIRMRCQNYHAAAAVIAESDYLLTLPRGLAAQIDQGRNNQKRPPPFEFPALELHLYWHANAQEDPANRWLREVVLRSIQGNRRTGPA